MADKFLQPGMFIKIEIDTAPPCLFLQGTVKKTEKNTFVVEVDIEYAQKEQQKVECTITDEIGTQACLFKTVIKYAEDNQLTLIIPDAKDVQIVQRRRYIRVPINEEVDCYLMDVNDKRIGEEKIFSATAKNIGGDGVLLNTPLFLEAGTVLVFEMKLDDIQFLLTAKVLRGTENTKDGTSDLGCQFIGISDSDRQKIIAYCNKQQLILKRKNRI